VPDNFSSLPRRSIGPGRIMASRSATDAAFTLVTRVAVPRSLKMIYSLDRPRASASFAHTPLLPDLAAGTCRQAPLRRALKNGRGRGVQAALPFDSFLTRRGSPSVRPYGFAWRGRLAWALAAHWRCRACKQMWLCRSQVKTCKWWYGGVK
jgi:hypothetical protein